MWEYAQCHDVKSTCLAKVLVFFDKCIVLNIPKHVSEVIGSLLYFKKQIKNGVYMRAYQQILIFIFLFMLEIPEFFIGDFGILFLCWKSQVLLLTTSSTDLAKSLN
jgi:hypothetical protein